MKVAIVHDFLKEIGGAEQVLMSLKRIYPDADVYTAFAFASYWGRYAEELSKWKIIESWGRWLPGLPKMVPYYTAISPLFFGGWDLSKYDLVIVSATGGYLPNGVKVGEKTRLVTYCHTPPRFLYGYPVATKARFRWYWRPVAMVVEHVLRMVDYALAQRPQLFVANSQEVAMRIKKFYRRDSVVIYPPVEGRQIDWQPEEGEYFLMISRIVGSKNIELAAQAAKAGGWKLVVAGRAVGGSGNRIVEEMTALGARYLGEIDDNQKAKLLAGSLGVLCLEECADFGIVAVEPQLYGVPVVAYRAGGYVESVQEGISGVFVDELTVAGVNKAISEVKKRSWDKNMIARSAKKFSEGEFKRRLEGEVAKLWQPGLKATKGDIT
jgi:glycosyltransferase involved in cell wall biosynthesis